VSTISIADAERPLAIADPGWIERAFEAHAKSGQPPCVRVLIRAAEVEMTLQTLNCPTASAAAGRPPSRQESEISRLWNMEGLSSTRFTAGQVAAFVERVRQYLR
jgi:hypothetical protein